MASLPCSIEEHAQNPFSSRQTPFPVLHRQPIHFCGIFRCSLPAFYPSFSWEHPGSPNSGLRFISPVWPKSLQYIFGLRAVTYLHLQLNARAIPFPVIPALNGLRSLQKLVIRGGHRIPDHKGMKSNPSSSLKHLKEVHAEGDGRFQVILAKALALCSLKELKLEFTSAEDDEGMCYIPPVVALYATGNTHLQHLDASCSYPRMRPDRIAEVWTKHPEYADYRRFLAEIACMGPRLRCLNLVKIPFFSTTILQELLALAQQMPTLESLALHAISLTSDNLILPRLSILEDMAKTNPRLLVLETQFNFSQVPGDDPTDSVATQQMNCSLPSTSIGYSQD